MASHLQTKHRQLLLDLIREAGGHVDAKELFKLASAKNPRISPATVYRNLKLFKETGLVEQKRLGQVQCFYEIKGATQHQHLVCRSCGKVIEFTCPVHEILEKVRREQGFVVTRAEICLEGYCDGCAGTQGGPDA